MYVHAYIIIITEQNQRVFSAYGRRRNTYNVLKLENTPRRVNRVPTDIYTSVV